MIKDSFILLTAIGKKRKMKLCKLVNLVIFLKNQLTVGAEKRKGHFPAECAGTGRYTVTYFKADEKSVREN